MRWLPRSIKEHPPPARRFRAIRVSGRAASARSAIRTGAGRRRALVQEPPQRLRVPIETSVLKHGQRHVAFVTQFDEPPGLDRRDRNRFVITTGSPASMASLASGTCATLGAATPRGRSGRVPARCRRPP